MAAQVDRLNQKLAHDEALAFNHEEEILDLREDLADLADNRQHNKAPPQS